TPRAPRSGPKSGSTSWPTRSGASWSSPSARMPPTARSRRPPPPPPRSSPSTSTWKSSAHRKCAGSSVTDGTTPPGEDQTMSTPPANPLAEHVGKHPGELNVMDPALLAGPFRGYGALREQGRVVRGRFVDDSPVWLITRFDDVREVLRDPRFANNPA